MWQESSPWDFFSCHPSLDNGGYNLKPSFSFQTEVTVKRGAVIFLHLAKPLRDKFSRSLAMKKKLWQTTCLVFRLIFFSPYNDALVYIYCGSSTHKRGFRKGGSEAAVHCCWTFIQKTCVVGMAQECLSAVHILNCYHP